jgi:hypothetical protein
MLRKEFRPRMSTCRKPNEELTTNERGTLERWNLHFQGLLDGTDLDPGGINEDSHTEIPETGLEENFLTNEEVKQAVKKLKNNRAPGPDDINAQMIKVREPVLLDSVHKIISHLWLAVKPSLLPRMGRRHHMPHTKKKGDPLDCPKYRSITLLNTAYKIFSDTLYI